MTTTRDDKPHRMPDSGYPIDGYEVASWYDGPPEDTTTPCTQLHFLLHIGLKAPLIMRFKSRDAVDKLIEILKEHRDYVWREDGDPTGNRT